MGPDEVFAYVVGIAGHPGFTARFSDELAVPGVRVPLTADADLFAEVAELGRTSIWLQSFGDRMAAPEAGRPPGASGIRLPDGERPTSRQLPGFSRPGVPEAMTYDEASREIRFDDRIAVGPVSPEVVAYEVNGMNVLRKWFGYRKADPEGRTNTGLSTIHPTTWPAGHLTDLLEICNVLERIVALEPAQAALLERVLDGALIVWPEVAAGITPATKPKPVWASGTQGEL